jgi:hypothetical protein
MEISKTEIIGIVAAVIVLTIVAICLFPQSADPLIELIKTFLSLFAVSLCGAASALVF